MLLSEYILFYLPLILWILPTHSSINEIRLYYLYFGHTGFSCLILLHFYILSLWLLIRTNSSDKPFLPTSNCLMAHLPWRDDAIAFLAYILDTYIPWIQMKEFINIFCFIWLFFYTNYRQSSWFFPPNISH